MKLPPISKTVIKRVIWLQIALNVLILDQISKWFITEIIFRPKVFGTDALNPIEWYQSAPDLLPFIQIKITGFFNLVMAWNTGVSFSMFSGGGQYMPYILIALASGITILFTIWLLQENRNIYGIAYALVIGGALGNIIDRARFKAVIDFLDVHIAGYHWPAFNVADMAVVIGVTLLIILSLFFDLKDKDGYPKNLENKLKDDKKHEE